MSSFQEIQNDVMNHFGASDLEFRDEIKIAINDVIAEINDECPQAQHTEKTATFTTTLGTSAVTSGIPTDFDHLSSIYLIDSNGKYQPPLIYLSRTEWQNNRLFDMDNSQPTHYNVWDGVLYVSPKPDKAYTGYIDYYIYDSELTLDADTCDLTDHYSRWERVIRMGAIARGHQYLATDTQMINISEIKYREGIRRFRAWIRKKYPKSPEASRMKSWKEQQYRNSPLLPYPLRRYN
jgi:hypothetical protein